MSVNAEMIAIIARRSDAVIDVYLPMDNTPRRLQVNSLRVWVYGGVHAECGRRAPGHTNAVILNLTTCKDEDTRSATHVVSTCLCRYTIVEDQHVLTWYLQACITSKIHLLLPDVGHALVMQPVEL